MGESQGFHVSPPYLTFEISALKIKHWLVWNKPSPLNILICSIFYLSAFSLFLATNVGHLSVYNCLSI